MPAVKMHTVKAILTGTHLEWELPIMLVNAGFCLVFLFTDAKKKTKYYESVCGPRARGNTHCWGKQATALLNTATGAPA